MYFSVVVGGVPWVPWNPPPPPPLWLDLVIRSRCTDDRLNGTLLQDWSTKKIASVAHLSKNLGQKQISKQVEQRVSPKRFKKWAWFN